MAQQCCRTRKSAATEDARPGLDQASVNTRRPLKAQNRSSCLQAPGLNDLSCHCRSARHSRADSQKARTSSAVCECRLGSASGGHGHCASPGAAGGYSTASAAAVLVLETPRRRSDPSRLAGNQHNASRQHRRRRRCGIMQFLRHGDCWLMGYGTLEPTRCELQCENCGRLGLTVDIYPRYITTGSRDGICYGIGGSAAARRNPPPTGSPRRLALRLRNADNR